MLLVLFALYRKCGSGSSSSVEMGESVGFGYGVLAKKLCAWDDPSVSR